MRPAWLLTNDKFAVPNDHQTVLKKEHFRLVSDADTSLHMSKISGDACHILLDGYFLTRISGQTDQEWGQSRIEIIAGLYEKYGSGFINHIKGIFTILIIRDTSFEIYNDQVGINRFFFRIDGNRFTISNRIGMAIEEGSRKIDLNGLALFSLVNHYTAGTTFLEGVRYSRPATKLCYNGEIQTSRYWHYSELTRLDAHTSREEVQDCFHRITGHYLQQLNPENTFITLTGGLDSRAILASLLANHTEPSAVVYGDPGSKDVVFARDIASRLDLRFHHPLISPTPEWFDHAADGIIEEGNGWISVHRAHRFESIRQSVGSSPGKTLLFGGYMGGELIRNFYYDGVIVNSFLSNWLKAKNDVARERLISEELKDLYLKPECFNLKEINDLLSELEASGRDRRNQELDLTFQLLAETHHSQDLNLFHGMVDYPVPLFLDIDFLEALFSSASNFMKTSGKDPRRLFGGQALYAGIILNGRNQLADFPLAKKGWYTLREWQEMNPVRFLYTRTRRYFSANKEYAANFPYGKWFAEYVSAFFESRSLPAREVYDLERMEFPPANPRTNEQFWRKYTNLIQLDKQVKKYFT